MDSAQLKWSLRALWNRNILLNKYNEIDIYIEDTSVSAIKAFNIIFERLLNGKYKIVSVLPLGGRTQVIQKYLNRTQGKPSLFIVDGDLFLCTKTCDIYKNNYKIFVFNAYCIENILLQKNAIESICAEDYSGTDIDSIKDKLDFVNFIKNVENCLFDLFIAFSLAHYFKSGIQTISLGIGTFITQNGKKSILDKRKISQKIQEIRQSIIAAYGIDAVKDADDDIQKNITEFFSNGGKRVDIISAKDFIFKLLRWHIESTLQIRSITNVSFYTRLAYRADINGLKQIQSFII